MAFGFSPLIDNFNRADALIASSSCSNGVNTWGSTQVDGSSQVNMQIVSQVLRNNGAGDCYINASFGPDVEIYATITDTATTGYFALLARIQGAGTAGRDAYQLLVDFGVGTSTWKIIRVNPYTEYVGATSGATLNVGDRVGFEVIGTAVKGYHDTGSGWGAAVVSGTASDISSAGPIGIGWEDASYPNVAFNDLGGGSPGAAPSLRTRPVQSNLRWG